MVTNAMRMDFGLRAHAVDLPRLTAAPTIALSQGTRVSGLRSQVIEPAGALASKPWQVGPSALAVAFAVDTDMTPTTDVVLGIRAWSPPV